MLRSAWSLADGRSDERRGSYSRSAACLGGRNVPDRGPQALGGGGRVGVGGDPARGRDERRGRARRRRRRRAARAGRPGRRRRGSGRSSAASARAGGRCGRARWRRRPRPSRSAPEPPPGEPLGEPVDQRRQALVQRAPRASAGPGGRRRPGCWSGPGRRPRRRPASAAATSGSSASAPSSGLAVKASAPRPGDRPPGRRRLADQRLAVGRGGDRHVAALAVGDDQQARLPGGRADLFQRRPAGGAEPLEAGELRLDRDAGRAGALDQRAAVGGDGTARRPRAGVPSTVGPEVLPGQLRRVGVETEADLAAALLDERRQPVREGSLRSA